MRRLRAGRWWATTATGLRTAQTLSAVVLRCTPIGWCFETLGERHRRGPSAVGDRHDDIDVVVSDAERPEDLIRRTAADSRADLIVCATHGRRGIRYAMLGSVTERILRSSPVPTLSVRSRALETPPKHLLVPVDLSNRSEAACDIAATMAERFGAHVHILHVFTPIPERK